ncbi:MAG: glycosyltransferase family 2 protein [Gemmatimonadales bacterium]
MAPADFIPALPWLVPFASLFRLADTRPSLSDVPPAEGTPVSVIIPARNESATIETVVRSVLASRYRPLEVIVVDDRSTDDTAARVARLAADDGRLRLLSGAPLPPGWFGKPWACVQGARAAGGRLLLFTDADTRHEPELLGRAVAALEREQAALVTVAPHQRCVTLWERLIMPQIWLLLGLRYHPRHVNRARRERDVIANGQFILTTREAYDEVRPRLLAGASGGSLRRADRSGGGRALPGGAGGDRARRAVLVPHLLRDGDSARLWPGVSSRGRDGAVHRDALDLAREAAGGMARAGVWR